MALLAKKMALFKKILNRAIFYQMIKLYPSIFPLKVNILFFQ